MSDTSKPSTWKFAVAYALLGGLACCAIAGLVLGVVATSTKASKASVQKIETQLNPTVKDAIESACAYVAKDASANGVVISECRLFKSNQENPRVSGDEVKIALAVKALGGDYYLVGVTMNKGIYQPVGQLQIAPQGKHKPASREIS